MDKGYLTTKEVQIRILAMFDDLLQYLNDAQIPYILTGGSALGAIRHAGFIPWDDDMDIGILRDDYQRLIAEYKPSNAQFCFKNLDCDPKWENGYARVIDLQTASENQYLNINHGVFLDIFPIDHLSDGQAEQDQAYRLMKFWDVLRNSKRRVGFRPDEARIAVFLKKVLKKLVIPFKINYFAKKMDKLAQRSNLKYKNSNVLSLYVVQGINKQRETNPAKIYLDRQKISFEGRYVYITKYDKVYLTKLYGAEYMNLPPINERKAHGRFYNLPYK